MANIYYLGYYDTAENKKENRGYVLAATNKMTYIISALDKLGNKIEVISASATKNKQVYLQKRIKLSKNVELLLFKTLPHGNVLRRVLSRNYIRLNMLKYLLKSVSSDDIIIVYHSVAYANIVRFAKKIKKFKLVLEVEEIYADVNGKENERKKEIKLFKDAEAYIFPTQLLNEKLNKENKPYAIIHGTYQVEPERKCNVFKANLQKSATRIIHCVYAGTFDPRKGGAIAAAAEHLPSNYHIHILGFGSKADTQNMKDAISKIAKKAKAKLTYDGLLSGEDYIRFIQSCDIGLSTQNPNAAFNDTSFPSKILSYMANGLRVVSIRIPAIETSAIGDYMYYYDKQTPQEIAKAIMQVDINDGYNGRDIISKLDIQFQEDLKHLLEDKE